MHDKISRSGGQGGSHADAAARQVRNRDYHTARARDERAVAAATDDPAARSLHLQLAELHDAAALAVGGVGG